MKRLWQALHFSQQQPPDLTLRSSAEGQNEKKSRRIYDKRSLSMNGEDRENCRTSREEITLVQRLRTVRFHSPFSPHSTEHLARSSSKNDVTEKIQHNENLNEERK